VGLASPGSLRKPEWGTVVAERKEAREFDGEHYVMERQLRAGLALVKAWKAITAGNLVFRRTARNFNPNIIRLAMTATEELHRVGGRYPLVTLCVGVRQELALLLERA
jgi:3-oxoacid CoA-transferase subunit A